MNEWSNKTEVQFELHGTLPATLFLRTSVSSLNSQDGKHGLAEYLIVGGHPMQVPDS